MLIEAAILDSFRPLMFFTGNPVLFLQHWKYREWSECRGIGRGDWVRESTRDRHSPHIVSYYVRPSRTP